MMTSKQDEQKTKSFFWQSNNQSGGFFKGGNDKNSKQIRTNGYSDSILDLDNEDIKKMDAAELNESLEKCKNNGLISQNQINDFWKCLFALDFNLFDSDKLNQKLFNKLKIYYDNIVEIIKNEKQTISDRALLEKISYELKTIKDNEKAETFLKQISDKACIKVLNIFTEYFYKNIAGFTLPDEAARSSFGNLFVPGNAKFMRKIQNERFVGELITTDKTYSANLSTENLIKEYISRVLGLSIDEKGQEVLKQLYESISSNDIFKSRLDEKKLIGKEDVYETDFYNKNTTELEEKLLGFFTSNKKELNLNEESPFYEIVKRCLSLNKYTPDEALEKAIKCFVRSLICLKKPLFLHEPCEDDINQGAIGDCYFMASIISVLNSKKYGPKFIMKMMRENEDGRTVTVRLYRASKGNDTSEFDIVNNIVSLHPVYVNVHKLGVLQKPRSATWVQVLERAYASIGGNFVKYKAHNEGLEGKNYEDTYKGTTRKIKDLEGGQGIYSLMTLTGNVAYRYGKDLNMFSYNDRKLSDNNDLLPEIQNAVNNNQPITIGFIDEVSQVQDKDDKPLILSCHEYSIVGIEGDNVDNTILILKNPHKGGENISISFNKYMEYIKNIHKINDLEEIFNDLDWDSDSFSDSE